MLLCEPNTFAIGAGSASCEQSGTSTHPTYKDWLDCNLSLPITAEHQNATGDLTISRWIGYCEQRSSRWIALARPQTRLEQST